MQLGLLRKTSSAGESIAGVPVIAGTEVALSGADAKMLADWLKSPGFEDDVLRRCRRGQSFGFRITRRAPGAEPETSEVAIDLGCNSIGLLNQEGAVERRSDAFFDRSRAELLSLLRRVHPQSASSLPEH